jgi:hypothetical protein
MNSTSWRIVGRFLLLLSLISLGCGRVYRSEAVWLGDGSVDRAIYQEIAVTPDSVRRPELWQQVTYAASPEKLEREGWSGRITQLPVNPSGTHTYFAAWGRFQSPQAIPDYVLFKAPEGIALSDGKLVRDCRRKDYGLVVEFAWKETLTDVVRLDDMRRAREELADLLIDLWQSAFERTLGQDYDQTGLVKWLRTEGKAWLAELTDFAFAHCAAKKGPAADRELWKGLAGICTAHGLPLQVAGKLVNDDQVEQIVKEFVVGKLCLYVVHKRDGKPLGKEMAAAWWADFSNKDGQSTVFAPSFKKVIETKYASSEEFERRMAELLARVFGLYYSARIFSNEHFDCTLTVPGEIVETNGQLLASSRVRWQFQAEAAYPLGYVMECRSLFVDAEAQKQLLPGAPLASREAMLELVSLVAGKERLAEALVECRRKKSMAPLYEFRQRANTTAGGEQDVKSVERILKLCELPANMSNPRR